MQTCAHEVDHISTLRLALLRLRCKLFLCFGGVINIQIFAHIFPTEVLCRSIESPLFPGTGSLCQSVQKAAAFNSQTVGSLEPISSS